MAIRDYDMLLKETLTIVVSKHKQKNGIAKMVGFWINYYTG
jgi:hypothetical protein